jgi:hypothetical protein
MPRFQLDGRFADTSSGSSSSVDLESRGDCEARTQLATEVCIDGAEEGSRTTTRLSAFALSKLPVFDTWADKTKALPKYEAREEGVQK